jgi:chromosomal replication initiator protein
MMLTVTDYAPICTDISSHNAKDNSLSPVLKLIAENIGEKRYALWFGQDTQCAQSCADGEEKVIFYVRNNFASHSLRRHCKEEIDQAFTTVFGKSMPVDFQITPVQKTEQKQQAVVPSIPVSIQAAETSPLGSLFKKPVQDKEKPGRRFASLTSFLEGLSNRLACRAADLAIHHPGQINPIYIFGPTSVGKTHLLEGIWSAVRKSSSRRLPLYMTSEQFLSAFVETIRSGALPDRNQSFRSRFKNISHLLIDDIQFFARKESTQTELLQVFDMLRNQGVQLVFTGDRPLKDLPLRNELLCRLESGMICGIDLPERELTLRICERMIQERELPMEAEVCRLISSRFGVHARQISGALNRLHALYLMNGEPITVSAAEEALSDLLRLNRRDIRLQDITKLVCETFEISEETLRSKSRVKQIATPRMLAMWLARKYTRSALSEIGVYFGNHSHSSVISAQRKVDKHISENAAIAETLQKIEQALG